MPGRIFNGGTFGPGWVGEEGDIYLASPQIYAKSTFAKGTVFENPRFFWVNKQQYSEVGEGSVLNGTGGCVLDWVSFDTTVTIHNCTCPLNRCVMPACVDCAGETMQGNIPYVMPANVFVATAWGAIASEDACATLMKCKFNYVDVIAGPGWEVQHAGVTEQG
jgi:hypothetical protein